MTLKGKAEHSPQFAHKQNDACLHESGFVGGGPCLHVAVGSPVAESSN
eukprot:CAMPEP_0170298302 /NCGR_PEP_ID=MMETSP0116_2-20130129/49327_1 /TAXON_ID=400756 /ORGANISM="Durinskia baltica, Strain CSIRO CS-38" /LENGTH=47 /DNA_ID= /DNA_START= /DNA_END= /DNA_ORIENTATION=